MSENLIDELKKSIDELKIEIIQKQTELDSLIDQYQQLAGIEFDEDEE